NLADSFSRFFKKQNKAPRFKSKNNNVQSYKTKYTNGNIAIIGNKIKLPKLGLVRFSKSRDVDGRILHTTVRRNPSGRYFISILSDGRKIDNNKFTIKMEKKLKKEQRKLSRRALHAKNNGMNLLDAKNYQKQRIKVARLHEKVMNQREDFLHKLSTGKVTS